MVKGLPREAVSLPSARRAWTIAQLKGYFRADEDPSGVERHEYARYAELARLH
jgi:hypothetical protein